MTAWPSVLPAPEQVEGYGYQEEDQQARTAMEVGPDRVRRRTSAPPVVFSVTWRMSSAELAILEGFLVHEIAEGALWFDMALQVGMGFVAHQVRFKGPFKRQPLSHDLWRITAQLEARARQVMDLAAYQAALGG